MFPGKEKKNSMAEEALKFGGRQDIELKDKKYFL